MSLPSSQVGLGPDIPLSCLTIAFGSSPERKDKEINRLIASDWAAALPPAFPIVVNTSHRPFLSSLIVIYKVPSPVRILLVTPFVWVGLERGILSVAFSGVLEFLKKILHFFL